jgi:uncharacterized protein
MPYGSVMTIRRRARLDPGQVRDQRGGRGLAAGGIGGIGLIVVLAYVLLGGDPGQLPVGSLSERTVGGGQGGDLVEACRTGEDAAERDDCRIVGYVNSVQAYWSGTLEGYQEAPTTFFEGSVSTGCGTASSAVGPFYCPVDQGIYIDLGFFDAMKSQLGTQGGPLAEAYIIAHEYGHHVQNLTGVLRPGERGSGTDSHSVRVELQADCFAGAWAANAVETGYLEPITDAQLAQALDAAAAVGDDRIQERTQGQVTPETWTHGSADQRQRWFRTGFDSGDPNLCDTFSTDP